MKFLKLLMLSAIAAVQGKVLNFTQYESEWVKGKEYSIQYTYLEEPTFSDFQLRLYNSLKSIVLDEISTEGYNKKDIHTITLKYPDASTGKYRIVGLSDEKEISNYFSVKLVLKASTKTTSAPTPVETVASTTNTKDNLENNKEGGSNIVWIIITIIASILVVILVLALLGVMIYNRRKNNNEADTSLWKVPVTERSVNRGGSNSYSFPNTLITEKDISFSEVDGFYSYSSQFRNPEFNLSHNINTKERKEKAKSVYSYSTNVTKISNNILDILYPSNEKKENEKSLHERSFHEKSELSIDLGNSHSQKGLPRRKKHTNSPTGGQPRIVSTKSVEKSKTSSEARNGNTSFRANAMFNRKSRVPVPDNETNDILNRKSRVLDENLKTINTSLLNENVGEITNNVNNNNSLAIPSSLSSSSPTSTKSISALKNDKNFNEAALNPESPEYYIKHTKLNKKYTAVCNYKPSLSDEMNISKNDVIVVQEVFTDGWGLGKNLNTDKEGLLPLNCLNIDV